MEQGTRTSVGAVLLALAALGTTTLATLPAARAVTFAEPGDAGQTLPTALPTGTNATTALTGITGTLGTSTDADVFVFTITSTTTFSAIASSSAGIDTSLFLFSSTGAPLLANDDASGTSFQGALLAGNALLTTLGAGTYYLGISLSGNEAVNAAGQQLFTLDQPTTGVRTAASGLNPARLGTFNGATFVTETGAYAITLTGAATSAVPEPGTYALLAAGATTLGLTLRRRRQPRTA